jgi:hypothetical protein
VFSIVSPLVFIAPEELAGGAAIEVHAEVEE